MVMWQGFLRLKMEMLRGKIFINDMNLFGIVGLCCSYTSKQVMSILVVCHVKFLPFEML